MDEFHLDEVKPAREINVVDLHDVRVAKPPGRAGLPGEEVEALAPCARGDVDDLQCDFAPRGGVLGPVYGTHASRTDLIEDSEARDAGKPFLIGHGDGQDSVTDDEPVASAQLRPGHALLLHVDAEPAAKVLDPEDPVLEEELGVETGDRGVRENDIGVR